MEEINPVIVGALVTGAAAVTSMAVTSVMNFAENKKKRNVAIITQQSTAHKASVKRLASHILAGTNPILLAEPSIPESELPKLKQDLIKACSELEITIRIGTEDPEENNDHLQINNTMRELVQTFFQVSTGQEEMSKLTQSHTTFREMMSAFDSACWRYTKLQADGKKKKGVFSSIYKTKLACTQDAEKPQDWVN